MGSEIDTDNTLQCIWVYSMCDSTQPTGPQSTPRKPIFFIEQLLTDCQSKTSEEVMQ